MLKVYIEESALNTPQPMEVSAEAPVGQLVPALIDELQLPRTDLFGNRLVYFLRHTDDGRVLPDHFTLSTAGIENEDYLSLESYIVEDANASAPLPTPPAGQTPAFYTEQTIADFSAGAGTPVNALPPLQATQSAFPRRKPRRWTRRALLAGGGAALGLAGVGLAYAGLHAFMPASTTTGSMHGNTAQKQPTTPAQTAPQKTPVQQFVPAHAQAQLVFARHQQTVRAVAWSPDGKLLASGGSDQQLLTWNVQGQVQRDGRLNAAIRAVAWSPDQQQLAVAANTRAYIFNAQNGKLAGQSANIHRGLVMALAWSPQQPHTLVSGALDRLAVVWNTQTFRPVSTFRGHTTGILAVGWAADGQTVGSSSLGGVARIWHGTSGQEVHGLYSVLDQAGKGVTLNALAFQPGGNMLAVGGMDGKLRIWQNGLACQTMGQGATKGQCVDMPQLFAAHTKALRALAWSPDGRFLATGGDDAVVHIWYPARSQAPLVSIPQAAPVLALNWAPGGKTIAVAAGKNVTLWALS